MTEPYKTVVTFSGSATLADKLAVLIDFIVPLEKLRVASTTKLS